MPAPTPSQTVGPFFAIGLCDRPAADLVEPGAHGVVHITGRVLDGAGEPVPDAMVEVWQADERGEHPAGFGWGRCGTDDEGRYAFTTVKPGAVEGQAPHLTVLVFARGLLKPVLTRLYFPDEADGNERDPVLSGMADAERATLIARRDGNTLSFDIRLQGEDQTTFFAL